ncbi:phage tail sheath family protein [Cuspidothrix issatschenkoi LEGE 03284]|jgi:phage tail sheath protein FI|uniref:phage tail sheath family protein n=1 Tax=Cuspidothrix issatschenkoi TaxID=230752 RepID=UPI00187DDC17|nr:phage tail sheath C-terminal domain-containing protein [Cuspidothrix issatschenkoi]MBE9232265.1 phage tail sheath family protein [Cuspidothrix issatschenkoi LEGE 03284]
MVTYKTPNVYVEEISTFPPSVAEVSTAIPAFIGYTEKAQRGSEDLTNQPTRISSLLEYETLFGKAESTNFEVTTNKDGIDNISSPTVKYLLYYALRLYFDNGGGSCYIVSVGKYSTADKRKADFETGLAALEKEDEPTLILLTDAVNLSGSDYYGLCQKALEQCKKLKDRFTLVDVLPNQTSTKQAGDNFRSNLQVSEVDYLKYGAAYYPYLQTALNYYYTDNSVIIKAPEKAASDTDSNLLNIKTTNTDLYNKIQTEITKKRVVLPPSAAVAGVYARVDRDRGVWKAPANVSLASVLAPTVKISNEEQDDLNVDPNAGKSINAIRSFTGKGTLIWGARTLAGNDNEWRYIPVRRLFNLIEESIQKATAFVVFESNNPITWLKVKSLIDSYLEGLWRQGALAGSTPEQAYFVNIGLGKSMTNQDVLEGRMIVEIGIAAVRPAEFIILKFSHKLQEL